VRTRLLPALALVAVTCLAGARGAPRSAAAAPTPPITEVQIQEFRFAPATIEVSVGTTVRWVNHDEEPHTVAFLDGQVASPALDTDDVFSRRFDAPGTYAYRCAIHPHMAGTIVVR
jgi:plastocyanin